MAIALDSPVTVLPGVGPVRGQQLARLGVKNLTDLLRLRPRRYLDFRQVCEPTEMRAGDLCSAVGRVTSVQARSTRRGAAMWQAVLATGQGKVRLTWFLPRRYKTIPPVQEGQEVIVAGEVSTLGQEFQFVHPLVESADGQHLARIIPVYPLTQGLSQGLMRRWVMEALPLADRMRDSVPRNLLDRLMLPTMAQALTWLHCPPDMDATERARQRLAYEEALVVSLAMAWRRNRTPQQGVVPCQADGCRAKGMLSQLPYELTPGQSLAITSVREEMERPIPMQRLIHGDVGSGKTTVAMYAAAKAADSGFQSVLLTPTRLLAEQHMRRWGEVMASVGIRASLLVDGSGEEVKHGIAAGTVDLVIGTHALFGTKFARLGLVIVDEQHRFGVAQRAHLAQQWPAHCLYLSATPIPRSLALLSWGDVDLSVISTRPAGRPQTDTRWVGPEARERAYKFVRRQVEDGHQAYIVFPRIGERDEESGAETTSPEPWGSVLDGYARLKDGPLAGLSIGLLHGQMAVHDQEMVMHAFAQGRVQVLVTTTVVEVGIDVAKATVMVIEQADLFGLAQLHQLRGRVGRGAQQSYCLLVAAPRTEMAVERLQALRATDDGFTLAERDLQLRGPGEVLGCRQSGYGELQYALFPQDLDLIRAAQGDAEEILAHDNALSGSEHRKLKDAVAARLLAASPLGG